MSINNLQPHIKRSDVLCEAESIYITLLLSALCCFCPALACGCDEAAWKGWICVCVLVVGVWQRPHSLQERQVNTQVIMRHQQETEMLFSLEQNWETSQRLNWDFGKRWRKNVFLCTRIKRNKLNPGLANTFLYYENKQNNLKLDIKII